MNPATPPVMASAGPTSSPKPAAKRRPWLLYVFGGLLTFLLAVIATSLILLWWSQRPMKPTVLSEAEKVTLEGKLQQLSIAATNAIPEVEPDRIYVPGSSLLRLTEREINGLLNENTDLGKSVRLEFGRDAINAYVAAPIPEDVPLVGGKMFRARGRFRLSLHSGQAPTASLEDITVYGVSMPNAWLGGLKGENLLNEAMGGTNGLPLLKGVKSLRIEPGVLLLELEK